MYDIAFGKADVEHMTMMEHGIHEYATAVYHDMLKHLETK